MARVIFCAGVDLEHDDQRAVPRLLPRLPLGLRLQRTHHAQAGGGRAGKRKITRDRQRPFPSTQSQSQNHNLKRIIFLQMVCGSQTFDLAELKKVTYYDGYKKDDITVQHFWEVRFYNRPKRIALENGSEMKIPSRFWRRTARSCRRSSCCSRRGATACRWAAPAT